MKNQGSLLRKSLLSIAIVGALASLNSTNLLAEEAAANSDEQQELGAVSVTASRVETEIKDIAGAISIIDREELDTLKFDDAVELMKQIPGYSMSRNLRIPVGSQNYTVNLIDGLSIASPFGSGVIGLADKVNTLDIERIEVVKGPASALYGSHAIGGTINIITRKPPAEPEVRIWGEAGQNSRSRGGVSAAGSNETMGYFVDANILNFVGWQEHSAKERTQASAKAIFDLDMDTELTLRLQSLDSYTEDPGTLDQAEFDADWSQADPFALANDLYSASQSTTATAQYKHNLSDQSAMEVNYGIRSETGTGTTSYNTNYRVSTDTNHNLVGLYRRDLEQHDAQLIVGMDLQHSTDNTVENDGSLSSDAVNDDIDVISVVTSPFMQYEFSTTERVRFSLGARYDRIAYSAKGYTDATGAIQYYDETIDFKQLSPKVGVTYQLSANNSLWASYGRGFVVPSEGKLITGSSRYDANPDLLPEKANDFELGLRGSSQGRRLNYDITLYRTDITDMQVLDKTGADDIYVNASHVRIQGVETALSFMPVDSWKIGVAHTYADNKFIDYGEIGGTDYSGNTMSSSPLHHLNARVTWMPIRGLAADLEWNHVSAYYTDDDNALDPDGQYQRPDLLNLRVSYKDGGPWAYWGHVKNLANTQYAEGVSYTTRGVDRRLYTSGVGRNLYAGASYSWK